jgi:radical SAM superfamily enzyme YgiQ (UPF0313 family)
MRVLLVWPKARTDPEWGGDLGAIAEPLALEYIGAVARQRGLDVRILDMRLVPSQLDHALEEFAPAVVGVTAFSMHVSAAKAVLRRARQVRSGCLTVVGGHHATLLPEDFFVPEVDFVVCGEGTSKFGQLLDRFIAGDFAPDIGGVWRRGPPKARARLAVVAADVAPTIRVGSAGCTFVFGGSEEPLDLSRLPLPDRSLTSDIRTQYFIDWMKPVALLRSTVGCPFRCSFCSLWTIMGGRYHKRPIEDVVTELATIDEEFIFLIDDEAFIDGKRMKAFAAAIREAGIRKRLFAYCRIDTLIRNRDVVEEWHSIGLERLLVGIDAITNSDIEEYHKDCSVAEIEQGLQIADQIGVQIFAQFVVNTNYAHQDFVRLRRFVERHRIRYPSFTVLTPLPGTKLLGDMSGVVMRQPDGRPDWDFFDTQNAVTATVLPPEEFRREYRSLYRAFKASYSQFHHYHTMRVDVSETVAAQRVSSDLKVGKL